MALTKITPQMFDTSAAGHDFNIDNGTFVVDASANRVGIGVTTPTTKFHIFDGGTDTGLRIQSAASADNTSSITFDSRLADNTNKQATITAYRGNLNFSGDSGYGKVGIGTSTPSTLLDVNGSVSATSLSVGDILFAGSTISDGGDLTLDVANDIILDADSGVWRFKDAGTTVFQVARDSNSYLNLYCGISDMAMRFQGNDGGSTVTALTLDMSAAGEATFNSNIISGGKIGIGTGSSTINADSVLHLKSTQPNIYFEDTDDSKSWRLEAGSVFKLQNITTSTEAFRIDQIGTLAVGTTDTHSWNNVFDGRIRIGARGVLATTTASTQLGHNFYYDGAYKYIGADFATRYYSNNGEHVWLTAPSGSADGTITFSNPRMIISNAGNVGIGTTNPLDKLDVGGTLRISDGALTFDKPSVYGFQFLHNDAGNDLSIRQGDANNANYVTRFNIGSSGNIGIGTSSPSTPLHILTNDSTTNTTVNSLMITNLSTGTTTTGFGGEIRFQAERNNGVNQNTGGIRSIAEVNSGTNISSGMAFDTSAAGVNSEKLRISYDGKVGIGATSPLKKLDILGESSGYDQIMIRSVGGNNTTRSGGITGINYSGNQLALMNYYTDSGQTYLTLGSMGSSSFRGPTMIRFFTAAQNGTTHTEALRITDKFTFASGGSARNADVALEVNGPLKITNNTNAGVSQTHTNMTAANSGKLLINFASIGTMTTGDTIVFTYAATSWKSWFFKIRWSSTGGYMGELWAGGYNNNSDGYGIFNPKYRESPDNLGTTTTDGATLTVSRNGQQNTMTLTLNNNHVHPLFEIEYACGGGEGYPNSSKASITVNS